MILLLTHFSSFNTETIPLSCSGFGLSHLEADSILANSLLDNKYHENSATCDGTSRFTECVRCGLRKY
jgi:hypothetical protein